MKAFVNGKQVSDGNLKDMSWTFAQIIERASYGVTLHPGEVIGSGTVGTGCFLELNGSKITDNQWLKPGDEIILEVDQLGKLVNTITHATCGTMSGTMNQTMSPALPGVTGPLTLFITGDQLVAGAPAGPSLSRVWMSRFVTVNLLNDESLSPEHLKRNPMGYVPVLEVPTREKTHFFIESTAIIEWLEELKPTPALLPKESFDRAKVRALCELINAGTQPIVNLTVNEKLTDDPEERKKWNAFWIRRGFNAFEKSIQDCKGEFALETH